MNLKQVKPGEHLHWPSSVSGSGASYRGGPGYVLDLDAPCERAMFVVGQEHKLVSAPVGLNPDPITNAVAIDAIKRAVAAKSSNAKPSKPEVAKVGGSLPGIDLPSKRSKD